MRKNRHNFNPRTHEECDNLTPSPVRLTAHFNPRTHEECDRLATSYAFRLHHFNPRTHEECDVVTKHPIPGVTISIHALTRSATTRLFCFYFKIAFQSTHSRGVRRLYLLLSIPFCNFNPRTHEECDFG